MKHLFLTVLLLVSANSFAQQPQFAKLEALEQQIKERLKFISATASKCVGNPIKIWAVKGGFADVENTLHNAKIFVKCSYISSSDCQPEKLAKAEQELVVLVNQDMAEGSPKYNMVKEMFEPANCNGDESYHKYLAETAQMTKGFFNEFYRLKQNKPASPAPGQSGQAFDLRMAERFTPPLRGHGTSL